MALMSRKGFLLLNYIPLAALSSAIITPALPIIQSKYDLTLGELEWVVSVFLIGYMIGQLIYGPWANRIGRVRALCMGLIIGLLGMVLCYLGYWFAYWILLLGRVVNALGTASALVCAVIMINEEFSEAEAKTIFSFVPMAFTSAVTISIFIGGLITYWLGWQYTLFFTFLHNLVMLFLVRFLPQTFDHKSFLNDPANSAAMKVNPINLKKLVAFSFITGLSGCLTYAYTTAAPIITHINYHFNPRQYGTWNLISVIGVFLGTLTVRKALTHFEGRKVILLSLTIIFFILISFLFVFLGQRGALWFFLTSSVMYFGTTWGYSAGVYYGSNALVNRALGSSILNFITMSCAVMSVIILGYLTFNELLDLVIVGAIFLTIAWVCYIWLSKNKLFTIIPIKKP